MFVVALVGWFWLLEGFEAKVVKAEVLPLNTQHLSFVQQGHLLPQSGFLHLRLKFSLVPYEKACQHIQEQTALILSKLKHVNNKIDSQFQFQVQELNRICNQITSFQDQFQLIGKEREKRSVLAVGGALAGIFSLFSLGEIISLESRFSSMSKSLDTMQDIVEIQDHRLGALETDFESFKNSSLKLASAMLKLTRNSEKLFDIMTLNFQIQNMRSIVQRIFEAVQVLFVQKFPVQLLNHNELEKTLNTVVQKAQTFDMETPLRALHDLFQIPTSFLVQNSSIVVFVHVPIFKRHESLHLTKFLSVPIKTEKDLFVQVDSKNKFLAFSQNFGITAELSQDNLEECHKMGNTFLCPNLILFKRNISTTCLGSLYVQSNNIERTCPLAIVKNFAQIVPLGLNSFFVTTDKPTKLVTSCDSATESHLVSGPHILNLSYPCTAMLQSSLIRSQILIDESLSIERKAIPFQNLTLFWQHSESEVQEVLNEIRALPDTDKISINVVRKKLSFLRNSRAHSANMTRISLISAGSVVGLAVLVIMTVCIYKKNKRGRQQTVENANRQNFKPHSKSCSHADKSGADTKV